MLLSETGESLPIEGWFDQGFLERFSIPDPRLIDFVAQLEDKTEIEKRLKLFVASWLNGTSDVSTYIVPSVGSEAMLQTLESFRDLFHSEQGEFQGTEINVRHPHEGGATLQYGVTLTGTKGSKEVTVSVEVGAFGGLISGINF